jgi:hypothetical protein
MGAWPQWWSSNSPHANPSGSGEWLHYVAIFGISPCVQPAVEDSFRNAEDGSRRNNERKGWQLSFVEIRGSKIGVV